jgi:cellulose synthase operon protein YhjQ
VVAHLATLLARQGRTSLAVELSPQNLLGLHLGMPEPSAPGWASLAAADQWWADASFDNTDGVGVLPFGQSPPATLNAIHDRLLAQPRWLQDQLELLDVPADCTVLLDTPVWPAPLAQAALRCADTVLVALEASARASALQPGIQAMLHESTAARQGVLVTRFDPRRTSHREALQLLREQWRGQLIPYTVHEDENIPRALARSMCVDSFAPQAQSSHDLQGVCNWLAGPPAGAAAQP